MNSATDPILYRSRLSPTINRKFEVFTPANFQAAMTLHPRDDGPGVLTPAPTGLKLSVMFQARNHFSRNRASLRKQLPTPIGSL